MIRFAGVIFLALTVASCQRHEPPSPSSGADTAKVAADTALASPGTLLDYSPYDTCQGEFEGSYEEEHGKITVSATVLVRLDSCRVTEIIITDSSHINPKAARLIPQRIIESQNLPVDEVTGASVSSWTIMTATATALGIDLMEIEE